MPETPRVATTDQAAYELYGPESTSDQREDPVDHSVVHRGRRFIPVELAERITGTDIDVLLPADRMTGIHLPPGESHERRDWMPALVRFTGADPDGPEVHIGDFERMLARAIHDARLGRALNVHAVAMDLARTLRAEGDLTAAPRASDGTELVFVTAREKAMLDAVRAAPAVVSDALTVRDWIRATAALLARPAGADLLIEVARQVKADES